MGTGGCALKANVACNVTDSGCIDSTHAIVCNSDGMGFKSVDCPANTVCSGFGNCIGTCVVGSSRCNGPGIVQTCTDGFTYTDSNCMPGQTSCVQTSGGSSVLNTAACMPISCAASGTQCGNKAADPSSTDPNYASVCTSTPQGVHWQSEQCAIGMSCVPGSGCVQQCLPGQQRCSGSGIQTCTAQATWGTITACTPTATGAAQLCQYPTGYNNVPVCGDAVCYYAPGACESDGFHQCVNGKVAATGTACTQGTCVGSSTYGGFVAGSCQVECNPGDQRCDGNMAYQTCSSNYTWSTTTQSCTLNGTDFCVNYTDTTSGRPKILCGQCAPGSHRCTDAAGTPGASPPTDIETCDSSGHWGQHSTCSVGQCSSTGIDAACVSQCVPGSTVCLGGAPASPPNPEHPGTTNWGQCDANGNLPSSGGTACSGGTSCRKGPSGQPVGIGAGACVQCVGGNIQGGNENGLVDGYCTSTTALEMCTSSNTWNTASTCSATAPYSGLCRQEDNKFCYTAYPYCTNSYLVSIGYGGCAGYWGVPSQQWGTTPDCCEFYYCERTSGPIEPATCD
jgi:hypothetical protein